MSVKISRAGMLLGLGMLLLIVMYGDLPLIVIYGDFLSNKKRFTVRAPW